MSALLHPRHWSLGVKGGVIIAASLALLLGSAATSYTLERSTAAATADMLRTMQVQADIQRLHTQIAEAATGVRGYLLTGRDDFLAPYSIATRQLPATMARLQETVNDPEQRSRLDRVRPLLQSKLDSLEELRGQRHASSVELQQHLLASKQVLDQLRAEIGAMNVHETELVAKRTLALQQASNRNLWMTIAVIAAGLAGALATLTFTFGLVRRVRLAAENAERLNSDLPLKPTLATTDELGQLADRLHQASVLLAGRATAAQAASQAKTEFLARTSHELRTPLNAILGYAQLLEGGLSEPRDHEHAVQIRLAGQHLLSLIDEVLDIGRIEAGKLTLDRAPVALAPLVAEALALMLPVAQQRSVTLRHDHTALAVMADLQRLRQVLLNVVSNGIKYGAAGGTVSVSCTQEGSVIAIHIDDSGPGIPAAMQDRLFTPFDRLGIERGKTEGAGLGLAVSKSLMQAMHGDIRHQPGAVTRFTLTLPAATAPEAAAIASAAPAEVPAAPAIATTHSLVCIDDDAATRTLIATLMQRRPHWRLSTAIDAAGGLALARLRQPDLLLAAAGLEDAELRACARKTVVLGGAADAPAGQLSKPLNVPAFFALLDQMEQTP